MKLSAKNNQHW